jgi:hypothetical protein
VGSPSFRRESDQVSHQPAPGARSRAYLPWSASELGDIDFVVRETPKANTPTLAWQRTPEPTAVIVQESVFSRWHRPVLKYA